jgi:hypothetical protein
MREVPVHVLFFLACIALAVPHSLALLNFRRRLVVKQRALENLLSDEDILKRYVDRFPAKKGLSSVESIAKDYFDTYYNRHEYLTALVLNILTDATALLFVTARIGFPSHFLPQHVVTFIRSGPWGDAVLWSLIGSYLWNCYDLIRRTANLDLSPDAFTGMWLKLWIAAAVASIISAGIMPGLQPSVGFAIGLISIPVLFEIVADRASKVLDVKHTDGDTNTQIKVLQGATADVIDTLDDFDIESTVQLAYCDPMNVMMSTNLPWVVIIDLIDQALLFNYIGVDVAKIRSGGYRGAIEVATIGANLNGTPEQRIVGLRSLNNITALLGWTEAKAIDLVQTLYTDSQVSLIWDLFGGNFAKRDTTRIPDAETVKMVIKADLSTAASPESAQETKSDANVTAGAVDDKVTAVVAQNQDSQISSSKEEITITVPPAPGTPSGDGKPL